MTKFIHCHYILLGAVLFSTAACGGAFSGGSGGTGGFDQVFDVSPKSATVIAGQTVTITVTAVEYPVSSFNFSITEGTAGGTIVAYTVDQSKATYTAPSTPGTYHVVAGFTEPGGEVHQKTVPITVMPPI